jgi:Transcription elongation factor, GreA/GreB, C-term
LRTIIASRLEELKRLEFEYVTPTRREPKKAESAPALAPRTVVLPLFKEKEEPAPPASTVNQGRRSAESDPGIAVGDTVRMKYLTDDRRTLQITISKSKSDPSRGVVYHETPVAKALLGAEVGDEVEVLVGSCVRPAVVERIVKGAI